jgi:hypothetical protein
MALRYTTQTAAADWLLRSGPPPFELITMGPAGFAAYARLRFIPDPSWPGQAEADVEVAQDHPSDLAQTARALRVLAPFTNTADECYFCAWEGYSGFLSAEHLDRPLVSLPHRRYALFVGRLTDIDDWAESLGGGPGCPPPAFVWPADRRWCFTHDVDPHYAGIGGEEAAITMLLADPELDVVRARPGDSPPAYR